MTYQKVTQTKTEVSSILMTETPGLNVIQCFMFVDITVTSDQYYIEYENLVP